MVAWWPANFAHILRVTGSVMHRKIHVALLSTFGSHLVRLRVPLYMSVGSCLRLLFVLFTYVNRIHAELQLLPVIIIMTITCVNNEKKTTNKVGSYATLKLRTSLTFD